MDLAAMCWIMSPEKISLSLRPQNVPLFWTMVVAAVISYDEVIME